MSKMAKEAREAMKRKVTRLVDQADPKARVDGSSYTPPEMLDADVQTGMRPVSRRQYKRGGAVAEGEAPKKRADRRSRRKRRTGRDLPKYKDGGSVPLTADSLVNKDMKEANELREGKKHIGGLKKGGRAERAKGGSTYPSPDDPPKLRLVKTHADDEGRKAKVYKDTDWDEYRVKFFGSDGKHLAKGDHHTDDLQDAHSTAKAELNKKGWKAGGRAKRAAGGVGSFVQTPMQMMMEQNHPARRAKDEREKRAVRKSGGRTGKMGGGAMAAYALSKNKDALKALSPIANLKRGGMAHSDVKMDTALIKSAMHKHEKGKHPGTKLTKLASGGMALDGQMQGTRPTGGRLARKDGGTVTNIYFDSKKGGGEGPPGGLMPPMMPPPMPPMPPPGMPPGGPPMPPPHMGPPPGGPPGGPPMEPPPGMPPGGPPGMPPMMRRAGGRVGNRTYRKPQDMDAGAGSGLGRLEKIQIQKGK